MSGLSLFVLGGARSGKSRYAQSRIEACPGRLAYIATGQSFDDEMADRITRHRQDRGPRWITLEEPVDLAGAMEAASRRADAVLVDCLTLWASNLMLADHDIDAATWRLCETLAACECPIALVSNEVGWGIVPDNPLARTFRDVAGRINQHIAAAAREVQLVVAGLPLQLK